MGSKTPGRVLVFGDDMRIFLAVVRSLGRSGKEVHAVPFTADSPALTSKYISAIHHVPRYSDDAAAWIAAVLKLLREHQFDLVIPCCDDRSILPFDKHRAEFSSAKIAIPNPTAIDLLFDKDRTRQLSIDLGIPVTTGVVLSAGDTAKDLAARFGLPLILKPRKSYALDRLDKFGKVWIVDSLPMLESLLANISEPSRFLVEKLFEGSGVGVSVLADQGQILTAFQHRRLREGRGGSSSYRISEPLDSDLMQACQKICSHTKLTGVCMFEFRYNLKSKEWILLETNARFWGSLPLPLSLGVNFPVYLYDLFVRGIRSEQRPYLRGIRARNLVLDGFNLISELRYLRRREIGSWIAAWGDYLTQPIRWLSRRERSDSFVADDLKPGFWECAMLFRDAFGKITRRKVAGASRVQQRREQAA
jgi:predicted ATP-grasp superfamily ATP-dependent carboligase